MRPNNSTLYGLVGKAEKSNASVNVNNNNNSSKVNSAHGSAHKSLKEKIERLNTMNKDVLKEMDELIRRKWVVTEHVNIPLEDIVYEYENNYDEAKIKYGRIRDEIVMKMGGEKRRYRLKKIS